MESIQLKYTLLDAYEQKQVSDFIDFLLSRNSNQQKLPPPEESDPILLVSVWAEKDLELFDKNNKDFEQWKQKKW